MMRGKKNNGTALLTALLITAIAATLAISMILHQRVMIRETQLAINFDNAYLDIQGIQDWAMMTLINDMQSNNPEIFPKTFTVNHFNQADISGEINDQQALFNINSLTNPNNQLTFIRLLQAVDPHISVNTAIILTKNITNWLNSSNADETYMKQSPPYRSSHQMMAHPSELRLVLGISQNLYEEIAPFIAALPNSDNKININSAPVPVLMALADQMTLEKARQLAICRDNHKGFSNSNDFVTGCAQQLKTPFDPAIGLITTSNFFLVKGGVRIADQQFIMSQLLQRTMHTLNKVNTYTIKVLWQSWDNS